MWLTITETDIIKGSKSPDVCPITVALQRRFKTKKISVSRDYIRVHKKNVSKAKPVKWLLVPLPKKAQDFLLNYSNMPPLPCKFKLPKEHFSLIKKNI